MRGRITTVVSQGSAIMPQVPTHCKLGLSMGIRYLPPPWFDSPFFKTCFNGRKLRYNSAEATTTWVSSSERHQNPGEEVRRCRRGRGRNISQGSANRLQKSIFT